MRKGLCILALVTTAVMVGCGSPEGSPRREGSLKTVAVPQTAVKNQDAVGFCWSYATLGFLESKYRAQGGGELNLSEEALGFYRVVEELSYYAREYAKDSAVTLGELTQAVRGSDYQGWFLRASEKGDLRDSYELIEAYGVVPESAWNVKFVKGAQTEKMVRTVREGFLSLMRSKGRVRGGVSESDIVAVVGRAFGSVPPSEFNWNGRRISARSLASDVLGFRADDYVTIEAKTSRDVERIVTATKLSLSAGLSVPIGFGVNFSLLRGGTFSYVNRTHDFFDGVSEERAKQYFGRDGGHAVLVTDYVNVGGREGALPEAAMAAELNKSVDALSYLKVKNSWGMAASSNERGTSIDGSRDGYYRLDLGYLKGEADAGFLSVVVSKEVAAQLE